MSTEKGKEGEHLDIAREVQKPIKVF